ncbi:hypothetical protein CSKR_202606 [Clonorchis sinensis]|uniref:Uncharacterized protein n=1 Tax=Clonorchis sinensis TaxID=79923 RepID=A0A8T1M1Q5_CLOSI|nr:hypothetical protein CSKR_202606 [Clonorchis sinensis]
MWNFRVTSKQCSFAIALEVANSHRGWTEWIQAPIPGATRFQQNTPDHDDRPFLRDEFLDELEDSSEGDPTSCQSPIPMVDSDTFGSADHPRELGPPNSGYQTVHSLEASG